MSLEGATLGIYRVGRELGRGGMGTVHRAESTADGPAGPAGAAVALKVFHPQLVADERAFARFRLEAEIGKEIRHEHLVRTYEIGSAEWEGQTYHYMTMEIIEGKTLKGLLGELGTFPGHLLHLVADQVLAALAAIHERGVVHRDLKPENIVITPDHRVLLMDLGVARREGGHDLTKAGEFIGSLSYAPPEQFTSGEAGPRADIYAFGVTLFELATGKNPFGSGDVSAVLRKKLHEEVDPPRTANPDLEPFWDQAIWTCIRREKTDRFASAAELRRILAEGEESEWWRLKTAGRGIPSAEHALKRLRLERRTPLFGRAAELEQVREAHRRAQESGAVLFISGPSGVGKSRLLFDFLEGVAGAGGPAVGAGRGVGAGGAGFAPFVEAMGDLVGAGTADRAERRRAVAARVGELLRDTPGVVEPVAEFLLGNLQPGPDSALSKDALFAACVNLLRGLAAERPVVLVVEDLHLAGAETVELFAHLARCVPGHPILLAGVYADDELAEGSPLAELATRAAADGTATRIALRNLPAADTDELVRFVVRHERTVTTLGPTLREKSEGNPLIVLEVLDHLRESKALVEKDEGLDLAGDAEAIAVPSTVRDLAALKLAALDDTQRETLEVAAVLGSDFDAALLAEVLGETPVELLQRLAALERKHRLVSSSGKSAFRFARRQLFEAIYDSIPEALRGEYHSIVADALLAEGEEPAGERAYALLRHLFHAERATEASPFLETALDYTAANFHASYAAPFLERVAEAFAGESAELRFAIAMKLWACYELLASRESQMRVLDAARDLAEQMGEPGPRARVHALRAGSYWYAGDMQHAGEEAQLGLDLAREAKDRKWESTCYHTLGVVAYMRGLANEAATRWRQALEIRREIGDRRGEASTLQALSLVMPRIGEADGVLETMQASLAIWREIGERRGEASMLMNIGNHLVDAARYEEGLRHLEQAIEGHRDTGAVLNEATALTNLGRAQEILGLVDEARASWERALRLFVDLGNPKGELAARLMLGNALGVFGEKAEARVHLEAAIALAESKGVKAKLAVGHLTLGETLHRAGERAEAWEEFERALALEAELKSASSRVLTLSAMGAAALVEEDWERAAGYLADALDDARAGSVQAPLVLCRLARARRGAGQPDEARTLAREALERVEAAGGASSSDGPEIYFTVSELLGDEARREELLGRARATVEERAARIRNDSFREHYLKRTWPNAEILARTGG